MAVRLRRSKACMFNLPILGVILGKRFLLVLTVNQSVNAISNRSSNVADVTVPKRRPLSRTTKDGSLLMSRAAASPGFVETDREANVGGDFGGEILKRLITSLQT